MHRLLVTGGLGFIGSNFILYVHNHWKSSRITNLDAVSYGAVPKSLKEIKNKPRYRFIKGNTADRRLVKKLFSDVDVVVHFAAETHVDRSIADPESFLRSNVLGTFALLEAARRSDIERFVHISTDEVYGSITTGSFRETDRMEASSPYSASKAASDVFVEAYFKTYGLPTVTMRCTNNFGPRQFPEKFIPKAIINAVLGRKIPVYGSGTQVRDWIYVLDFCKAIALAVENGAAGTIYNVCAGNELKNIEVVKQILRELGKPNDLLQFVEDRPGHDFRYSLDSTRIRNQLGWRPEHTFREALAETVKWYSENESWWKPLATEQILGLTPWKRK